VDPGPIAPTGGATGDTAPDTGTAPPDPCDACDAEQVCDGVACVDPAVLVYVNFEAEGDFSYDPDTPDASVDQQASDPSLVGALVGYGDPARSAVVFDLVRQDLTDLAPTAAVDGPNGIHLVTERPEVRTDYHMVVLTPSAPIDGQIGLGSPLNCANESKQGIYFNFLVGADDRSDQFHANLIGQAIGRLVGLSVVSDDTDLLSTNFGFDTDLQVRDVCLPLAGTDPCPDFNAAFCPPGEQNTAAALRFHARQEPGSGR